MTNNWILDLIHWVGYQQNVIMTNVKKTTYLMSIFAFTCLIYGAAADNCYLAVIWFRVHISTVLIFIDHQYLYDLCVEVLFMCISLQLFYAKYLSIRVKCLPPCSPSSSNRPL